MKQLPFLSSLGVPLLDQARIPTPNTFPTAFNVQNKAIWKEAVDGTAVQPLVIETWALCIKKYVYLCEIRDLFPFQTFHQSRNDQICDFLKSSRQAVVKYLNNSKLLEDITLNTSHRTIHITDRGFILTVYAQATIDDPGFESWLLTMPYPHFHNVRQPDGRWIKHLTPNILIFVINGGHLRSRWHVGYEINCDMFPDIPGTGTPSKAELEKFILEVLWMPILRTYRPALHFRRLI